ncbi:MAG: NfeD family protein [Marinilabiliaceae bacterium]|nr:NfeD family protein [Marinilabiliaceae bacterium]
MEIVEIWHIWLIIAVAMVIAEIFSAGACVFLCFSLGCIGSGIGAYFGVDFKIQILIFSIVTTASFFTVRPFMVKYAFRKTDSVKTNIDAIVGQTGRVTETIDYSKNSGRVFVYGDDWKATSQNGEVIPENEIIEVVKIESTILVVKPINKVKTD